MPPLNCRGKVGEIGKVFTWRGCLRDAALGKPKSELNNLGSYSVSASRPRWSFISLSCWMLKDAICIGLTYADLNPILGEKAIRYPISCRRVFF